jgi:hypothetical protein
MVKEVVKFESLASLRVYFAPQAKKELKLED